MEPATFYSDLSGPTAHLEHFWEHTVGSGHATLALRADWQAQLKRCRHELGFKHVRFHGLLSDDMGTLVNEDDQMRYAFFNADQVMDFLLSIGMKPFVELSFMPTALASGDKTVFKYRGNITPPKDYKKWSAFIKKLVEHWVERYGAEEVRTWFFEVWNEPNLKAFWSADQQEYFNLYQHTAQTIKEVDDRLIVGGPATARNEWIDDFVNFCDANQVPADFVSTHHYPTDALGSAGEDTLEQLAHSRRGILRQWAQDSHRMAGGRPLYYTEWNASSNPRDELHDEPYTAAYIVKTMMEARGLVKGYSFWTFTDIFEENYFPAKAFQGGFGLLTMQGIAKPSYRAFQLLRDLGTQQCIVDGQHETVDAWVVRGARSATVLLTNTALPRHPLHRETVRVELTGIGRTKRALVRRIDEDHANPRRRWRELGEPALPNAREVEQLQAASELTGGEMPCSFNEGITAVEITLPPHSVASIEVDIAVKGERK
ncbi:MAG TPA: cellulase family glycosylhydrolase [Tepidisphaeraceae bacterium]|jgi:xylan 1,4-beta-xylosidase|nr:cellulase family glycosylhydrolase [Tepidisphaeraceae bacterium]